MAIGFRTGFFWFHIGSSDFLYSFFSTIAYILENGEWGSKYPYIMNELYKGELKAENTKEALSEFEIIEEELKKFLPDNAVWDFDDLSVKMLYNNETATDLSNFFITDENANLVLLFRHALEKAVKFNEDLKITTLV